MGKKKRKARPPALPPPAPRSKKKWAILIVAFGLLASVGGLAVWKWRKPPEKPKTRSNPPPPLIDELTPEQHAFMQQQFLPRWNVIRNTYPILDLRQRFDRLAARIQRHDIRLKVSALYKPGRASVFCESDRDGMQPIIRFFQPALRDFFFRTPDEEMRDDVILGVMLHEEYHLEHHIFQSPEGPNEVLIHSQRESATWWWCCDTIFTPMMAAGRLRHLPPEDAITGAMRCYLDAHGDQNAPSWIRFCEADPELRKR